MTPRRRLAAVLVAALAAGVLPAAAGADTPDVVEDDLLQIAVDRVYDEATQFFGGDYWSISVVRLSDGHLASANGDQWHVSLSAAKAVWVAFAMADFGAAAVEDWVEPIFVDSSNGHASRVLSLWVDDPVSYGNHDGANAVNAVMWDLGMMDSYVYGWFNHSGGSYGYHRSSVWKPAFPDHCCVRVWYTSNFMSTDDLATFWAAAAGGEILGDADTDQFLEWAALPRTETSGLIPNRLPAAATVSHKAGWNGAHTRRIDGGVVTAPSGETYAIAISFRLNEYQTIYWSGGAREWSRYASCEVYNVIAGTDVTCTRTGDPRAVVQHTAPPEGKLLKAVSRRGRLRVKGWALDPDAGADPVEVVITADGAVVGTTVADRQRTALQRTYGLGNFHGFVDSFVAGLSPGGHTVCATALNDSGKGPDTPLGCVDVVVDDPDGYPPQGALTYAAADGDVVVARGRARDRDTVAPIEVRLLVDGEDLATVLADRGAKHHKFKVRARLALDPGDHEVCAVALNYGDVQPDTPIGCLTVTVP